MELIFNEGGINWCWFTELTLNDDNTVTIHRHYRLHKYDMKWPQRNLDAPEHPSYYHDGIWKEDDKRTATEYFIPNKGWCKIANPMYIFNYKM